MMGNFLCFWHFIDKTMNQENNLQLTQRWNVLVAVLVMFTVDTRFEAVRYENQGCITAVTLIIYVLVIPPYVHLQALKHLLSVLSGSSKEMTYKCHVILEWLKPHPVIRNKKSKHSTNMNVWCFPALIMRCFGRCRVLPASVIYPAIQLIMRTGSIQEQIL